MTTKIDIDVSKLPVLVGDPMDLIPDPKNAKKHPQEQIDKLTKSIKSVGVANPIQVRPNMIIIAGHGRRLACIQAGIKAPYVIRADLTDAEADALAIADNKTASTDYDTELLQESVQKLAMDEFDLSTLGFDDNELSKLTSDFGEIDEELFVDDITSAVETQKSENSAKEAEIDAAAAPVSDALGFKRVTIEQSRKVRVFMSAIETKTGKQGADALIAFIDEQGIAA